MRARWFSLGVLFVTLGCNSDISYGGKHPDLFGRVTIDGRPAAGLTVVAATASEQHRVVTGPDGAYVFGQIQIGKVTVSVEAAPAFVVFAPATSFVELGQNQVEVNFTGYSPVAVSGQLIWEFAVQRSQGISGVPASIEAPAFPVAGVATESDGSYRFPRVPGFGAFPVVLGALPAGLVYAESDRWTYYSPPSADQGLTHTTHVTYRPSTGLIVDVLVDGRAFYDVVVRLDTPLPVTYIPTTFYNLPVRQLQVSISGFPSAIVFDATSKLVQLRADGSERVTFIGYTPGANRPPSVAIVAPANGATFTFGTAITFRGGAQDPEDGNLTGNALVWQDIGGGTLGNGATITVETLSVGQHRIALRATDSGGNSAVALIDVIIVPATGGRIVGTVRIDGAPAPGVRIDLSTRPTGRTVVTDQQGAYAFEDVPAGTYTVAAVPPQCTDIPANPASVTVSVGTRVTANFTGNSVTPCYSTGHGRARPPL